MSEIVMLIFVIAVSGIFLWIVSSIGNKIFDKGADAVDNKIKRRKNAEAGSKPENLADRYRK